MNEEITFQGSVFSVEMNVSSCAGWGPYGEKGIEPIMKSALVNSPHLELPGKYKVTVCQPCFEKYGMYFWIGRSDAPK